MLISTGKGRKEHLPMPRQTANRRRRSAPRMRGGSSKRKPPSRKGKGRGSRGSQSSQKTETSTNLKACSPLSLSRLCPRRDGEKRGGKCGRNREKASFRKGSQEHRQDARVSGGGSRYPGWLVTDARGGKRIESGHLVHPCIPGSRVVPRGRL